MVWMRSIKERLLFERTEAESAMEAWSEELREAKTGKREKVLLVRKANAHIVYELGRLNMTK